MPEIWDAAGDSFTKWLWNCDNILVKFESFLAKLDSGIKF